VIEDVGLSAPESERPGIQEALRLLPVALWQKGDKVGSEGLEHAEKLVVEARGADAAGVAGRGLA
jgi:hypothetical protein